MTKFGKDHSQDHSSADDVVVTQGCGLRRSYFLRQIIRDRTSSLEGLGINYSSHASEH